MVEGFQLRVLGKQLLQLILANQCYCKTDTTDYDLTGSICSNLVIHICSNLVNCICWGNEYRNWTSKDNITCLIQIESPSSDSEKKVSCIKRANKQNQFKQKLSFQKEKDRVQIFQLITNFSQQKMKQYDCMFLSCNVHVLE